MTTSEYMPDEWTATTTELLISVSTDSDLYTQKGKSNTDKKRLEITFTKFLLFYVEVDIFWINLESNTLFSGRLHLFTLSCSSLVTLSPHPTWPEHLTLDNNIQCCFYSDAWKL